MEIEEYLDKLLNVPEITKLLGGGKAYFLCTKSPKYPALFYQVLNMEDDYAEDEPTFTEFLVEIAIYSEGDYLDVLKAVRKVLKDNNLIREDIPPIYDSELETYIKQLRFRVTLDAV